MLYIIQKQNAMWKNFVAKKGTNSENFLRKKEEMGTVKRKFPPPTHTHTHARTLRKYFSGACKHNYLEYIYKKKNWYNLKYYRLYRITIDGVWIGNCIYWNLITRTTRRDFAFAVLLTRYAPVVLGKPSRSIVSSPMSLVFFLFGWKLSHNCYRAELAYNCWIHD
jgi:hypothetical protein